MMLTKLEIYAIVAVVLGLAILGAGAYGYHRGKAAERKDWMAKQGEAAAKDLKDLQTAITNAATIGKDTLAAVQKIRVVNVTTKGVIEREIQTSTVYANDCLPDSGRLLWSSLAAGRSVVPSGSAVPATNSGGGKLSGGNVVPAPGR